jgi:hypothetical protein
MRPKKIRDGHITQWRGASTGLTLTGIFAGMLDEGSFLVGKVL